MGSLHIDDILYSMLNTIWVNVVDCCDSQRIDLSLHILHDGCQTGAHIDDLHIFHYLINLVHCSLKRCHCSVWLHSFGRLLDNFVDSSSLSGSRQLHEFLTHRLHTMMLFHFSCYMGNILLYVLHVLGKCRKSISSEQTKCPVDLCLVDNYL